MGMFIALKIDEPRCKASKGCRHCVDVCPVDIFQTGEVGSLVNAVLVNAVLVNAENEDECTLCELCLQACPHQAIEIVKLYER